jgi:hypothetical protein
MWPLFYFLLEKMLQNRLIVSNLTIFLKKIWRSESIYRIFAI